MVLLKLAEVVKKGEYFDSSVLVSRVSGSMRESSILFNRDLYVLPMTALFLPFTTEGFSVSTKMEPPPVRDIVGI